MTCGKRESLTQRAHGAIKHADIQSVLKHIWRGKAECWMRENEKKKKSTEEVKHLKLMEKPISNIL